MNRKTLSIITIIGFITFGLAWVTCDMKQFADGVNTDAKRIDSLRKANPNFGTITQAEIDSTMGSISPANFKSKVDSFLKKYSPNFSLSYERYVSNSNDYNLDSRVKSFWNKSATLKNKIPYTNSFNQKVYQRLYLGFYEYDTKSNCSAALDSLLNCFGGECQKISWGANGQMAKTPPFVYLINEREIIVCHIACEHNNNFWTIFKHDMLMTFGNGTSRIIDMDCGGPINFNENKQ